MTEVKTIKSLRRKIAEAMLYIWTFLGFAFAIWADKLVFQERVPVSSVAGLLMFVLMWIGGVIFLGFFACLAPAVTVSKAN